LPQSQAWISPPNCKKIYDSQINVSIGWLWDGGINMRLGDEVISFVAEETLSSTAGIGPWLQQTIAHFSPDSSCTRTLDPEVKQLVTQRPFHPPTVGMRVPVRTAPRRMTRHSGMEEQFAFIWSRFGEPVTVDPPKVQQLLSLRRALMTRSRVATGGVSF